MQGGSLQNCISSTVGGALSIPPGGIVTLTLQDVLIANSGAYGGGGAMLIETGTAAMVLSRITFVNCSCEIWGHAF
eukprot:2705175-Prymnesium_polylepis.2